MMNNVKVNTLISTEDVKNKIAILKDDTVIFYDSLSLNHEIKMSDKDDDNYDIDIITKSAPKTKKPALYQVVLLNDDYTPMDFVISVLEHFFNKGHDEATQIMMEVHQKGVGIAGVFTYEVAETKVAQVSNFSRQHEHPLQCTMEKI